MNFEPTNLPIESEYPKLVRDNIPDIIKKKTGKEADTKILNDEEFLEYLTKKLIEESTEVRHSIKHGNMQEELADVQELIDNIIKFKGWTKENISAIQKEKRGKNGGFEKRILLLNK